MQIDLNRDTESATAVVSPGAGETGAGFDPAGECGVCGGGCLERAPVVDVPDPAGGDFTMAACATNERPQPLQNLALFGINFLQ
jgi:hypothetical protein